MSVKPVVALLTAGELFGGVERHLLGSCEWFQRQGIDPILILFFDRELARQARDLGVTPLILDNRGSFDLTVPRRLAALFAGRQVDVVHAHGYRAVVNAALARRHHHIAMVRTVHGLVEPSRPLSVTWLKSHVYDGLEKLAGAGTGASVCYVTDELRRRRTGGGPATGPREHIVHNGIDAVGGRRFQRPDDLPAGEFHFAAVGRVSPVKGLETALRAVQRLDSAHNPVLNIIGTGPSVAGLEVLARELGLGSRVRFLGFRENIYDYLAHIDVLVMPSHHEGLPYTILEAMSLATPIIASRVGGLAEVLEDGRTALLVEPGDIEGWAAAMGRLLPGSGMGRSLGAAAKEEQAGALTLESMGAAYWQIYSDLVEQKAEGALRSVR